ncbi:MAG: hypothetical protein HY716_14725 [Planctomycetes bacterium]|nr:hypothetical protein [Planctomycetota bacterium]
MSFEAGSVPFTYGDLQAITQEDGRLVFWFANRDGVIRGVPLDTRGSFPRLMMGDSEIIIRRGGSVDTAARASIKPTPGIGFR